jgi:rRNA maturation endonuclease Nob1
MTFLGQRNILERNIRMKMRQEINMELPQGSYRIVCTGCGQVFVNEFGSITEWALSASRHSEICPNCGGEVILEANPDDKPNKYDSEHPYPDNH